MHQLQRPSSPPASLYRYQSGRHRWDDVSVTDKGEIWTKLFDMQGYRCAYCESSLEQHGRHIEHFYQKASHQYPHKTFEWDNLFGSCNRHDSCGRHKDRTAHNPTQIIKPDEVDPEHYFQFLRDGRMIVRDNLTGPERYKAEETLRVFNLDPDHGPLKNMRKRYITSYYPDIDFLEELAFQGLFEEIQEFIQTEIEAMRGKPFETAIKHSLFSCF